VGSRADLEAVEREKILHCWESNPNCAARRYIDWAIQTIPCLVYIHIILWRPLCFAAQELDGTDS
jgi:hypothetical protein